MKKKIANSDEQAYSNGMRRQLITFDWAIKNILRSRENFDILEGFLSELLGYNVAVVDLLESESNCETAADKSNRVDLLAKDESGMLILIEVQYEKEYDYYQRMLFGSSKLVTQNIRKGQKYGEIKKIISVHIVYFDLGAGEDYLYKGTTIFRGLHFDDELGLSAHQKDLFKARQVSDIFPQYYIIRMEKYDEELKTPLDEWVYFLKTGEIHDDFRARNILKAKEKLDVLTLDEKDRILYDNYLENLMYEKSVFDTAKYDGRLEGYEHGIAQGREQGIAQGRAEGILHEKQTAARNLRKLNLTDAQIADATGLSLEEIARL